MRGKIIRMQKYQRLTKEEREEISRELSQGKTIQEIEEKLGRHRTTICRELQRNQGKTGYRAFTASKKSKEKASSRRKG